MWESFRGGGRHRPGNDAELDDPNDAETGDHSTRPHQPWHSLQDETLDDFDDGDTQQLIGDASIPQLPSQKKRATKKTAPKTARTKKVIAKQQTLDQAMSDADMDRFFNKLRSVDGRDDDEDVDLKRFLEDDDDDTIDNTDGGDVDASAFLETLINTKDLNEAPKQSEAPSSVTTTLGEPTSAIAVPVIKLEDDKFDFQKSGGSNRAGGSNRSLNAASDGSGYLTVEKPKQEFEIAQKFEAYGKRLPVASQQHQQQTQGHQTSGLFYWFDAREQPYTLSVDPGSLFLFGKMLVGENGNEQYRSSCLRVLNLQRCIFLLPRPNATDMDVVNEINEACSAQGIKRHRIKFVDRYYAFEEPGIPHEKTRWAKLRYSAQFAPFLTNKTFTHISAVMGANTSLLELFLVKRRLKGPCFLRVSNMTAPPNRVSHCEVEFVTDSPKNVVVEDTSRRAPPFTLASIQLHAQLDSKGVSNEIYVASVAVYRDVNIDATVKELPDELFTGVHSAPANVTLPLDLESHCSTMGLREVYRFSNEGALLKRLMDVLKRVDADMLIGHNFVGFTLPTLLRRCQELNVPGWSSIGRLDLKRFPRFQAGNSSNQEKETCIGRLIVDSYLLAREYFNTVNYKLLSLAEQMKLQGIAHGSAVFEPGSTFLTPQMLTSSKDMFNALLQVCNCAVLSTGVVSHLDAIRLTKRLSSIAGNLWSRTLCGARSERIEYLLLHSFHDLKFITPDKKTHEFKRGREEQELDDGKRKAKYQGGMVLDPKCGLYSDYILLLDFNSLYPSLIQEFNVCFTTVDREGDEDPNIPPPENLICASCAEAGLPSPCLHKCILPKVIKGLVDSRREVKKLMKTERDLNNMALLEIRQKALKLTANSMYGCLGFEHSRFHAQQLAELVTRQGRIALQNTVDFIPQANSSLRVIYGDTDSVMIQTGIKNDIKAVREIGLELKNQINKQYRSLEIDIDGVFRAILLLKKKKYAALSVVDWYDEGKTYKKEVKGLDMVRRDWCPLSKRVSDAVLNRVLNAEGGEDVLDYIMNFLRDIADHVRLGDRYTLDDFVISKSLTKEPEAYRGTTFPHASVALRMKGRKELVRVGDLIPYVICCSDGDKLADKAFHVDEVRNNRELRVDAEWYLSVQIFPPVMRLCEYIQGFSSEQLSEAMGIAYHRPGRATDSGTGTQDGINDFSHFNIFKSRDLSECFPTVIPFQLQCSYCLRMTPIDPHARVQQVLAEEGPTDPASKDDKEFDLYVCVNCGRSLRIDYVANCFSQMCYQIFRQFYESGGSSAAVRAVRDQFTYFRVLFDVPHAPGCPPQVKECHRARAKRCLGINRVPFTLADAEKPDVARSFDPVDPLHATAESFYKRIAHLFVNLDHLFSL